MSLLLSCQKIAKSYGATPLFEDLSLGLAEGDRVGLVGPNGCGKSTLLRILAGLEPPDAGTRAPRKLLRLAYVPQDAHFDGETTVEEHVVAALRDEHLEPDELHARVGATLARAGLREPERRAAELSGGWAKRLAIACALVRRPELLLMDEPTNHLDVEGILWLERLLRSDAEAYLVVSHDRWFLENVANRIVEINRCYAGGVLDARGSYREFLEKKDELLASQASYRESLANRVRTEVEWLRRGPKARTRKSSARIEDAAALQRELADANARAVDRTAALAFTASERQTKKLLEARAIAKRAGERTLFRDLDLLLSPGTRLGILGPNGSGKTTLLRLLAGELEADAGAIVRAPELRLVYLSQHRRQLDPAVTLRRALAPAGDQVVYQGRPIHVAGWARRFLFPAEQLEMPVARLSGGERARVAIARLMLQPADVLLLDEPTNDLDIPTLEVLEESLLEMPGALVLVTHDRFLFERVTNTVLALDGEGGVEAFADYRQWEESRRAAAEAGGPVERAPAAKKAASGVKKLSYVKRREWERMEESILAAERHLEQCRAATEDPAVASDAEELQRRYAELEAAGERVDALYARWAELEAEIAG